MSFCSLFPHWRKPLDWGNPVHSIQTAIRTVAIFHDESVKIMVEASPQAGNVPSIRIVLPTNAISLDEFAKKKAAVSVRALLAPLIPIVILDAAIYRKESVKNMVVVFLAELNVRLTQIALPNNAIEILELVKNHADPIQIVVMMTEDLKRPVAEGKKQTSYSVVKLLVSAETVLRSFSILEG